MTRSEAAAITVGFYIDQGRIESVDRVLVDNLLKLAADLDEMENTHANYPKLIGAYERAEAAVHKRLSADVPDEVTHASLADLLAPVRDQAH